MANANAKKPHRVEIPGKHLQDIPLRLMKVNPVAQREQRPYWVNRLYKNFDLDKFATPTVNLREDSFHIIDGQHSIAALKLWLTNGSGEGWEDQSVQCWLYKGLTDEQEAQMFLAMNNRLHVDVYAKYFNSLTAEDQDFCEIDRMVRAQNLVVSRDKIPGAIRAVGTLERVYRRAGSVVLGRTLRIIRDAYGDPGLEAPVLDGLGLLCQRYNGQLDEKVAIVKLGDARGGVNGLLNRANELRLQTGNDRSHCVAAAAVEIINRGQRGVARMPDWWKS